MYCSTNHDCYCSILDMYMLYGNKYTYGLRLVVARDLQRITVLWDYYNGFVVIVREG